MVDIGVLEIAAVAVVALIVIGPKRLPEVARNVGRWVHKARTIWSNLKREAEQHFEEPHESESEKPSTQKPTSHE